MYTIDSLESPARHPQVGEIAWPILIAGAGFSPKHIPSSNRTFNKAVAIGIEQFSRKLTWKWHFRFDSPGQNHNNVFGSSRIASKFPTDIYKWPIPGDIKAMTAELKSIVNKSLHRAAYIAKNTPSHLLLFKVASRLLRESGAHLVPTDKDGGFCYIGSRLLKSAYTHVIGNGDYVVLHPRIQDMNMKSVRLCKSWASFFQKPGRAGQLKKSMKHCKKECNLGHVSKLFLNAKTHKPVIDFRNIHLSSGWIFQGLSRFVGNILQKFLNSKKHVLVNTRDFVKQLATCEFHSAAKFAKADIKHFFMSGDEFEICALASSPFV